MIRVVRDDGNRFCLAIDRAAVMDDRKVIRLRCAGVGVRLAFRGRVAVVAPVAGAIRAGSGEILFVRVTLIEAGPTGARHVPVEIGGGADSRLVRPANVIDDIAICVEQDRFAFLGFHLVEVVVNPRVGIIDVDVIGFAHCLGQGLPAAVAIANGKTLDGHTIIRHAHLPAGRIGTILQHLEFDIVHRGLHRAAFGLDLVDVREIDIRRTGHRRWHATATARLSRLAGKGNEQCEQQGCMDFVLRHGSTSRWLSADSGCRQTVDCYKGPSGLTTACSSRRA